MNLFLTIFSKLEIKWQQDNKMKNLRINDHSCHQYYSVFFCDNVFDFSVLSNDLILFLNPQINSPIMPVKRICGIYDKNESNGHKPIEIPKYATIINNTMEMKAVSSRPCMYKS
jgi:hypothetical protein